MRKLFALVALTALLASCQREVHVDLGNGSGSGSGPGSGSGGGTNPNGTRLTKLITVDNGFTETYLINYDAAGRVASDLDTGRDGEGYPINSWSRYTRNGSGIIQRAVFFEETPALDKDSMDYNVHYDAAAGHYTSMAGLIVDASLSENYKDSSVFVYDASNRLVTRFEYSDNLSGGGYKPTLKDVFAYSGNNIQTTTEYEYNAASGSYELNGAYSYQHDSKTNPFRAVNEAPVRSYFELFANENNIAHMAYTSVTAGYNFTETHSYTYTSSGLPATDVMTSPGSTTSTRTFFYQ